MRRVAGRERIIFPVTYQAQGGNALRGMGQREGRSNVTKAQRKLVLDIVFARKANQEIAVLLVANAPQVSQRLQRPSLDGIGIEGVVERGKVLIMGSHLQRPHQG